MDPSSADAAWWKDNGMTIDADSHPELRSLLEGRAACVVRPDRYVMVRGDVSTVTSFARDALVGASGA